MARNHNDVCRFRFPVGNNFSIPLHIKQKIKIFKFVSCTFVFKDIEYIHNSLLLFFYSLGVPLVAIKVSV